jgi:hypothetical protein
MMNRFSPFGIALLIAFAGCKKLAPTASTPKGPIDACSLITKEEIQKVQESPVTEAKSSEASDGSFRIGQCFYTTETFNKSVTLAITQRDNASEKARDPKTFWKETFGKYSGHPPEKEGDEEKKNSLRENDEEGRMFPKKIEGIGEDAWWSANRMGGALYFLKDNVFVRISVGGPDTEETRIEKTKALALKALSRL